MISIIIENESSATRLLSTILNDYCSGVEVAGSAPTIKDGYKLIQDTRPDLVFLDIELDDGQSFELLDMLDHQDFKVIFTTAYDQYALKAFRYEAVDYILKPYTPKTVVAAVQRVQAREQSRGVLKQLNQLLSKKKDKSRINLATSKGIRLCEVDEILRLEADSTYCTVHLDDGEKVLLSKPLKDIEGLLPRANFFRVHSGHTVNLQHVKQVVHQEGGYVEMKDGAHVPLARRRKQEFMELLDA